MLAKLHATTQEIRNLGNKSNDLLIEYNVEYFCCKVDFITKLSKYQM